MLAPRGRADAACRPRLVTDFHGVVLGRRWATAAATLAAALAVTGPVAAAVALAGPFAAAAALVSGCGRQVSDANEPAAAPSAPKKVRCAAATARDLTETLEVHGTIAPLPDRDAQIAAQVAGRILRVLVREGDRVTRGQPLARVDDGPLRDQAQQAVAQLAKATTEHALAATTRARVAHVVERGIAARQELDDADARLANAQAGEAEAKATVEIANRQRARATVRSPLAGVVLRVFRRTGELVDGTAAMPIVEVGDPSVLELVGTAPAADLVRSALGAAATITVPALPASRLEGVVAAVSPAVDRATGLGVVRVTLRPAVAGATPPVGVTGTARVAVGQARAAVVVPAAALRAAPGAGAEIVVCGGDKRAHVVRIERGAAADGVVEARATPPLAPGTEVAVEPVLGIRDGDPIEPSR